MLQWDFADLAGCTILSGAPSGRRLYARLVAALPPEPYDPEPLLLDFAGVEIATASFLRESLLEFRNFVRGRLSAFYPVVANAGTGIIDEISELVHSRGDVLIICNTDVAKRVYSYQYIGKLDPMQKLAFDLVTREGETTASRLMERQNDGVKATAWNNRLSSLSKLGLICERTQGRAKYYKPIFSTGAENGG